MNHVMQGENECYPTVLAMLSNKPVPEVVSTLLRRTPFESWQDFMRSGGSKVLEQVVQENAEQLIPWMKRQALITPWRAAPINISGSELDGRGAITIKRVYGPGKVAGHVVAFENGTIYDPSFPEAMSFRLWKHLVDMNHCEIVGLLTPDGLKHAF